jgi:uncharacterized protein YecT (DUF1311 family)
MIVPKRRYFKTEPNLWINSILDLQSIVKERQNIQSVSSMTLNVPKRREEGDGERHESRSGILRGISVHSARATRSKRNLSEPANHLRSHLEHKKDDCDMATFLRMFLLSAALLGFGLCPAGASDECTFYNLDLPPDFAVIAAGEYSGRKLDVQIDQSGHQATQMDVVVNYKAKPLVLMLGAYEPAIWDIRWTAGTRIIAVLVGGHHRQIVTGLPRTTPVYVNRDENGCFLGDFYVAPKENKKLNPLSRKHFGRAVDAVYYAKGGAIHIGDPLPEGERLLASADTPLESFIDNSAPLAGPKGVLDAVEKGLLRKATQQDVQQWVDGVLAKRRSESGPQVAGQGDPPVGRPPLTHTYVVLKPFRFPAGMYGGNSFWFIIPKGVPYPEGDPGHSEVYDLNTMRCTGALCRDEAQRPAPRGQPVRASTGPVKEQKVARRAAEPCSTEESIQTDRSCLEAEVHRTDEALNKLYWYILTGRNPAEQDTLRNQQRAWIKSRDAECKLQARQDGKSAWFQYVLADDNRAKCVLRLTRERLMALNNWRSKQEPQQLFEEPAPVEASVVPARNARDYVVFSSQGHSRGKWYFEVQVDQGNVRQKLESTLSIGIRDKDGTYGTMYHIRPRDTVLKIGEGSITIAGGNLGDGIRLPVVTIGIAADLENGQLYYHRDGKWSKGMPGTAKGIPLKLGRLYKGIVHSSVPVAGLVQEGILTVNFGAQPFRYSVPDGYYVFDSKTMGAASTPAQTGALQVVPPKSPIDGLSQSYWVRKYYEWARSFEKARKPSADPTGDLCAAKQSGPVWFLAGSESTDPAVRSCVVPADAHVMVPILNTLAQPTGKSVRCESLLSTLAQFNADVSDLRLKVDGLTLKNVTLYRAGSGCFELNDVVQGKKGVAAGDGYWVFLKPLPPGQHDLEFGGKYLADGFTQNCKYRITVK